MELKKALTVFSILGLLVLLNMLVVSNPGMANKILSEDNISAAAIDSEPEEDASFVTFAAEKTLEGLEKFISFTGFRNATSGNIIMIFVGGLFFIYLAIRYDYEPLLLVPIGTGIIIGNIPFFSG